MKTHSVNMRGQNILTGARETQQQPLWMFYFIESFLQYFFPPYFLMLKVAFDFSCTPEKNKWTDHPVWKSICAPTQRVSKWVIILRYQLNFKISCAVFIVWIHVFVLCVDSVVERRALREGVFPKLREHCRHTLGLDLRVSTHSCFLNAARCRNKMLIYIVYCSW